MLKLTAINYTSHDALVIALHPTVCVQSIFTHNDAFSLNQLALIGSNYVNTHTHTHAHTCMHTNTFWALCLPPGLNLSTLRAPFNCH